MVVSLSLYIVVALVIGHVASFQAQRPFARVFTDSADRLTPSLKAADEWKGDVVSNTEDGKIRGCTVQSVGDSIVDWIIQIDGYVSCRQVRVMSRPKLP